VRTLAIIEARMTSTRLPGKVLADINGQPSLAVQIERLSCVPDLDGIVIATTTNQTDDPVEALAQRLCVGVWRGSEEDVLQRVLDAAQHHGADVIVEVTGDCPLADPAIVSKIIQTYREEATDYASNVLTRSYPIGMDVQVFATEILADAARRTQDEADREHVSLYIYRHPELYSLVNVAAPPGETRPALRLTLDTPQDLQLIRTVHAALRPNGADFSLASMLAFLDAHPVVADLSATVEHRYV
jgi:spore coat polysaccharide biosynthesis protein SpsF